MTVLDLFAGPGGWDEGALALGVRPVGIEKDWAACLTATAAGHIRVQADVATFALEHLRGKVTGVIGSPPCTLLSGAGHGTGRLVIEEVRACVTDLLNGRDTREHLRAAIFPTMLAHRLAANDKRKPEKQWTAERVHEAARTDAYTTALIVEPARYITELDPEWVALEQVPEAKPIWQTYGLVLRSMGWSVWTGTLNAADYGVPQTREREIFMGSRVRQIAPPPPTHADGGRPVDLFGEQLAEWISMATALGRGATERCAPTVTSGGTATGGAEPIARGGRDLLERERERGAWLPAASGVGHD